MIAGCLDLDSCGLEGEDLDIEMRVVTEDTEDMPMNRVIVQLAVKMEPLVAVIVELVVARFRRGRQWRGFCHGGGNGGHLGHADRARSSLPGSNSEALRSGLVGARRGVPQDGGVNAGFNHGKSFGGHRRSNRSRSRLGENTGIWLWCSSGGGSGVDGPIVGGNRSQGGGGQGVGGSTYGNDSDSHGGGGHNCSAGGSSSVYGGGQRNPPIRCRCQVECHRGVDYWLGRGQ